MRWRLLVALYSAHGRFYVPGVRRQGSVVPQLRYPPGVAALAPPEPQAAFTTAGRLGSRAPASIGLACAAAVASICAARRRASVPVMQELQDPAASLAGARAEAGAVAAWVEECGGSCEGVQVVEVPGKGVGLVATKAVKRGDVLARVPFGLGISAETALRSSIGRPLLEFEPVLADYAFIAIALLHERRLGEQSEFAPWLSKASLLPPEGFPDLPLLWDREGVGIAELDAATTAGATDRRNAVLTDYWWLKDNVFDSDPVLFPEVVFSYDAYIAAVAMVISRAVTLAPSEDEDPVPVLLPILDLPNHSGADPSATLTTRVEKKGIFGGSAAPATAALVATRDVGVGDEVCVRYAGTAGELLLDHGFLDEPVAPVAAFAFKLDEADPFWDEKELILDDQGMATEVSYVFGENEDPPAEFEMFLRLKHMGTMDAFLLEPVFMDALWNEHLMLPISKENEQAAFGDAAALCAALLAKLGGSVQADLQVLAEAERSSRAYQLAAVRYAERRALQAAESQVAVRLANLGTLEYYQERRLSSLGLDPVETDEELDSLRAVGDRAGGRRYGADNYQW